MHKSTVPPGLPVLQLQGLAHHPTSVITPSGPSPPSHSKPTGTLDRPLPMPLVPLLPAFNSPRDGPEVPVTSPMKVVIRGTGATPRGPIPPAPQGALILRSDTNTIVKSPKRDDETITQTAATEPLSTSPRRLADASLGAPVTSPRAATLEQRLRKVAAEKALLNGDLLASWPSKRVDPLDSAKLKGALVTAASNASTLAMAGSRGGQLTSAFSGSPKGAIKAPLALEIDAFIRKELRQLLREDPHPTKIQTLSIYREAFSVLLSRFPEYADVLMRIKHEYESTIDFLLESHQLLVRLQVENKSLKETSKEELYEQQVKSSGELSATKAQLTKAQTALTKQIDRCMEAERETILANDQIRDRDKEVEDLAERVRTLSHTIREQTAITGKYVQRCGKMRLDNDRLLDLCTSLQRGLAFQEELRARGSGSDHPSREQSHAGGPPQAIAGSTSNLAVPNDAHAQARKRSSAIQLEDGTAIDLTDVRKQLMELRTTRHGEKVMGDGGSTNVEVTVYQGRADILYGDDDDLREKYLSLEAENKRLNRKLADSQADIKALGARLESMQKAMDDDTLTPRPNWLEVQRTVPEFSLNHMASSREILSDFTSYMQDKVRSDLLENERKAIGKTVVQWLGEGNICESDLLHFGRYFTPKGTGPHVPVYLRSSNRVRDRKMRKGDAEDLLKKFWHARKMLLQVFEGGSAALAVSAPPPPGANRPEDSTADIQGSENAAGGPPGVGGTATAAFIAGVLANGPQGVLPPIDDFFLAWLTHESGGNKMAVSLAYNIISVCERYQTDPDCGLFLRILRSEVCEKTIFDQIQTVDDLYDALRRLDTQRHGFVTRIAVHRVLARQFPAKKRQDLHRLRFALITFCRGADVVDYRALFGEDHDGNQTNFVELLRTQHFEEIASHAIDVEESLRHIIDPSTCRIRVEEARQILYANDGKLSEQRADEILGCGCNLSQGELVARGGLFTVPAEPFLQRIRTGVLLKRYSPVAEEDNEDDAAAEDSLSSSTSESSPTITPSGGASTSRKVSFVGGTSVTESPNSTGLDELASSVMRDGDTLSSTPRQHRPRRRGSDYQETLAKVVKAQADGEDRAKAAAAERAALAQIMASSMGMTQFEGEEAEEASIRPAREESTFASMEAPQGILVKKKDRSKAKKKSLSVSNKVVTPLESPIMAPPLSALILEDMASKPTVTIVPRPQSSTMKPPSEEDVAPVKAPRKAPSSNSLISKSKRK